MTSRRNGASLEMKWIKALAIVWVSAFAVASPGNAQMPSANRAGLNAAMLKLFASIEGFTSRAEVRLQEKGVVDAMTMTVGFAMLGGKVRMDLDMTTIKSKQMPPEVLASFKAAGLDKFATVVRPDRKSTLLIYPAVRGYAETPMSKDELAEMDGKFKIEKTRLSRETIDGHNCEKNKVIVTLDTGSRHQATVWYAADLKDFPLKVQMEQPDMTVVIQYRDVKLERPASEQFDPPAGFAKHSSVEQLVQGAMLKTLGGVK